MQKDELSYAKTVVNASYVSRRGKGTCAVKQVPPSRFQCDEASSLKVKQHLIQLAKEEKKGHRKLDRSASLDYGRLGSRIFEYKIDSNRMAEKAFDNSRGYPIESDVMKPLALKPLVLSNSEVSLSQALSSELFSSGSIPSNKEIDRLLEVIKAVRQRNCSGDDTSGNRVRLRRHSDVSDLRNSKRSIKDPPSRSLTRSKSNGSSEQLEKQPFGSSRSAFRSIPRSSSGKHLHKRQCSQETIPEEDGTEEDVSDETLASPKTEHLAVKPERLYPVLSPLEDHMPPKPQMQKTSKVDVPEKTEVSSEGSSPVLEEPSAPSTPPDNSLRTTPSPDNETNRTVHPKPAVNSKTYVRRRSHSSSLGFSVRNPTFQTPQNGSQHTSGNSCSGPDDFVLQHSLMRKARQRHRMCSQPCVGTSPKEDDGVEKLPSPRYSPNTHPRARLASSLAVCLGNHPPVSYLNYIRRSRSLQVNHIALHEFRNLQRTHDNRLKYSDQEDLTIITDRDTISTAQSTSTPPQSSLDIPAERNDERKPPRNISSDLPDRERALADNPRPKPRQTELVEAIVHSRPPQKKTDSTVPGDSLSDFEVENMSLARRARQRRHHSLDGGGVGPAFRDLNEVKDLFKRVGRKYLSDHCVLPSCSFPEIEKRNSLSFVFDGNKELQEKVRTFFQQTNQTYCKRLIKQRFASNPLDCTPDGSVASDSEQGVRPLSEYADVINARIQSKTSSDLNESLQAYLLKSEAFVSNKCTNFEKKTKPDKEKMIKSDNFLATLAAPASLPDLDLRLSGDKSPSVSAPHVSVTAPTPTSPTLDIPAPLPTLTAAPLISTPVLPARTLLSSNNSECSECPFKSSSSKTSRDSGYGDSTSASNEGLNRPKRRNRSASLTILSKLKPLFGLRKRDPLTLDENNPFNKIFEDQPISEFAKTVDNFIARRSSLPLPEPVTTRGPSTTDYEDIPVFDSPSDNLSPNPSSPALNSQQVLEQFDAALNTELQATSVTECEIVTEQVSDEDDDFRVSPLPDDMAQEEEGDDEVFYVVRNSLEDVVTSPPNDKFSLQDIQEILDSFDVIQQTAPTTDKEYHKVHNMLQSKLTIALGSIYHTLSNATVPPNSSQYFAQNTLEDTLDYLDERLDVEEDNSNILELVGLLETFEDFINLHDEIISRRYYENETLPEMKDIKSVGGNDNLGNTNHSIYRMVGLHKNRGEPLGITLKKEDDKVVVHRILAGGMIDRQRLLHIGDVIISINNQDVQPKPEIIQHMLKDQEGDIHLKIIPSYREQAPACQVFVKAHFNYDPRSDDLIPCKEAGLKFEEGDILQIVNQDDPNWWQAKMEGGEGQAGLIPGLILQEQRMATKTNNNNEKSSSIGCGGANRRRKKKNKKMNYSANKNSDFDQHELNLYEEVAKMPPFDRKTLVLIGAQGVGRRSLISKLVLNEPDKFGNTMPHTSRPIRPGEKDGCGYWFTTREKMDEDIANHKYLEYGEYEKHLYGTKLDSIRQVMRSGKMCLLDVNPQSLKVLKTSEFVPYIVFIEAPPFDTLVQMHRESARDNPNKAFSETDLKKSIEESKRLKRQYSHYFDVIIQNNNMDDTYGKLYECISKLSTSPQWVPVNWFY
ncbi:hypothetical protein ACHWQZ_G008409 [Mnemiopsis leidyi]